jgi:rod shape-determining protein MreC
MESVLGRYRNLVILVGVLFLQILGLAVQVKRSSDTEHTRLIRVWAVDVITPFERVLIWAQNGTGNLWHNYVYLRGVRAENRQLKDQIEQLRLEQVRLNEDATQAHRLQALLAFKEQFLAKTVAAQVIGSSGTDASRILYIDKGEDQHIRRDMAVITADGIVGKVLQVYPSVSQVLLINDQSSGVGTILEKSRLQGVLKGTANGQVALEGVMNDEQVSPGEAVLTSGGDQIFPKGLAVGTVTKVSPGKDLFLNIGIKPAVDLSKLEEVLVVEVERRDRQTNAPDVGRVRAADILAQRLPSVPDKPPSPAANVGTAPAGSTAAAGTSGAAKPPLKAEGKVQSGSVTPPSPGATPKVSEPRPTATVPDPAASGTPKPAGQNAAQNTLPKAPPAAGSVKTATSGDAAGPEVPAAKPARDPASEPANSQDSPH